MGVLSGDGEVTEDELQPVAQGPLHFLDDGVSPPAIGALEVAVLHQRYGGVVRALPVVARAYGWCEAVKIIVHLRTPAGRVAPGRAAPGWHPARRRRATG